MKQVQFVDIERYSWEILIHLIHKYIKFMNFYQIISPATVFPTTTKGNQMADRNDKFPENIPGAYYVDTTCIDCDRCRSDAPQFFTRHEGNGYTYVYKQPMTPEEIAIAEDALANCPTETIGNDGLA